MGMRRGGPADGAVATAAPAEDGGFGALLWDIGACRIGSIRSMTEGWDGVTENRDGVAEGRGSGLRAHGRLMLGSGHVRPRFCSWRYRFTLWPISGRWKSPLAGQQIGSGSGPA